MLTQEQVHRILTLADHYAQERYRDSNYGTRNGFADRKDLVRYLEQLMQPDGVMASGPSELWKAADALLNALTAYEIAQQGQSDQVQRFAAGLVAAKNRVAEALAHGVDVPDGAQR